MAKCAYCEKDMLKTDGCVSLSPTLNGKPIERLKVGESDRDWDMEENDRCPDCNAKYGHYHHFGCDIERCPVCGGQFISCDCDIVFHGEKE